jgi:hypothetical protein
MEQLPAADINAMMKNKRATQVITQSSLDSTDGAREVGAS